MELFFISNSYAIIRGITTIAIILIYLLAFYWNLQFLLKSKWQQYSYLKLYACLSSLAVALAFIYIGVYFFKGNPLELSILGTTLLRPLFILVGGSIASSARARYTSLQHGGENWILPK